MVWPTSNSAASSCCTLLGNSSLWALKFLHMLQVEVLTSLLFQTIFSRVIVSRTVLKVRGSDSLSRRGRFAYVQNNKLVSLETKDQAGLFSIFKDSGSQAQDSSMVTQTHCVFSYVWVSLCCIFGTLVVVIGRKDANMIVLLLVLSWVIELSLIPESRVFCQHP